MKMRPTQRKRVLNKARRELREMRMSVCSEDLGGVMVEALGQSLSADDLTLMLETATGAGDRKVTFQDFCCLMNSTTP